jgi:hypothetical protein
VLLLQLLSQLGEEIGFTNQLSYDVVPASNTARFLIFSAVIVLAATTMIIATRGQLGRVKEAAGTQAAAPAEQQPPARESAVPRLPEGRPRDPVRDADVVRLRHPRGLRVRPNPELDMLT